MSLTSGISLLTCKDYTIAYFVEILLRSDVAWQLDPLSGEFLYDYYSNPSDVGNPTAGLLSQQKEILDDLDKKNESGMIIEAYLVTDNFQTVLVKNASKSFEFVLDASRPLLEGTWLTNYSLVASKLLVPLLKNNVCFVKVDYSDDYH